MTIFTIVNGIGQKKYHYVAQGFEAKINENSMYSKTWPLRNNSSSPLTADEVSTLFLTYDNGIFFSKVSVKQYE